MRFKASEAALDQSLDAQTRPRLFALRGAWQCVDVVTRDVRSAQTMPFETRLLRVAQRSDIWPPGPPAGDAAAGQPGAGAAAGGGNAEHSESPPAMHAPGAFAGNAQATFIDEDMRTYKLATAAVVPEWVTLKEALLWGTRHRS